MQLFPNIFALLFVTLLAFVYLRADLKCHSESRLVMSSSASGFMIALETCPTGHVNGM